jgi:hypothetical protein
MLTLWTTDCVCPHQNSLFTSLFCLTRQSFCLLYIQHVVVWLWMCLFHHYERTMTRPGSNSIWNLSNTLIVCSSLPNGRGLPFWDYPIGPLCQAQLKQTRIKYLKWFRIVFEPMSVDHHGCCFNPTSLIRFSTHPESSSLCRSQLHYPWAMVLS